MADAIYNIVFSKDRVYDEKDKAYREDKKRIEVTVSFANRELQKYLEFLEEEKIEIEGGRVGSIVVNCNPFTKGHLHLVEYAASQVDFLYIFVVEEDKSIFKFTERITLVKEGTSHLKNIKVLPSGKFIISSSTLGSYFEKEVNPNIELDATEDLSIFGEHIAQILDINVRFAGEEPTCNITRQYNRDMKRILPEFGVEFIEINRIKDDAEDGYISASRVRALLGDNRMDEIKEIVPECTYLFLSKKREEIIERISC